MPSKSHRSEPELETQSSKTPPPKEKSSPAVGASQELVRSQLASTEVQPETSWILGEATHQGSTDLSGSRGDKFLVGGKMFSANLGANTKSVSTMDLGSGRGDKFKVGGKDITANLGSNTKSVSTMDLGSGRGDKFRVGGKDVTANLGSNTKSVSTMDLGSGRGDKFSVGGKDITANLGANSKSVSTMDLGSGRGDKFWVGNSKLSGNLGANTKQVSTMDLGSGRDDRLSTLDIPGLTPATGDNVSVSLPLAMETAASDLEEGKTPDRDVMDAATKAAEEATLIHPEDIPPGLLAALPEKTILRFAFSPEDLGALDLQAEHEAVAKVADVFTLNNPTPETMKFVLESGQFEDVIWSGHGAKDGLWITDMDGKAKKMAADDVASLLQDTGVKEVLLNVCDGAGDTDNALADVGINSFAYDREIIDREAVADAAAFAESGSLWGIDQRAGHEKRADKDRGRVMTQKRAARESWKQMSEEQRFEQLVSQVGSWQSEKETRKMAKSSWADLIKMSFKRLGSLTSSGFGTNNATQRSGQQPTGGKALFKQLAKLFSGGGKGKKKGKKGRKGKKRRTRFKGLKKNRKG